MSIRTAFVFATGIEAAPLLSRLPHERLRGADQELFIADGFVVAICGIGLARARKTVANLTDRWPLDRIVNAGVAGALTRRFAVGDVIQAGTSTSGPHDASECRTRLLTLPHAPDYYAGARLLSLDEPVFDVDLKTRLAAFAELVDMEGHAIALECRARAIECVLLKVISDDATRRAMLHANLVRASHRLARFVHAHLEPLGSRSRTHDTTRASFA